MSMMRSMDFSRAQAMRAQRQLSAIGEDEIYEHVSSEEESSEEESESSQSALSSPKPKPGGTASKPAAKSLDDLDDSSSELLDMNHIPADEDGSASKTPPASTSRPLPAIPRGSGEDAIVDAITSRDVSNTRPQPPDPVAVGMQLERVPSSPSPRGTPGVTLDPHVNSNSSTSARVVVAARGNQSEDVPKFNSEDEEEDEEDGMEILHKAAPPRVEEEYDASSDSDEIVSLNQSGGSSRSRNSSLGKLVSKPLPQQLDPDLRRPSAENLARRPTPVFKPGPLLTDSTSNPRERGQRASLHRNPSSGQDDEKRDSRRLSQNPPTRRVPSGPPKKGTTTTNARPATRSAQALRTRPLPTAPAAGGGRALNLNLLDDSSDSDEVLSYASMAKRKASGGGGGQRVATSAANAKGWPVAEPVVDRTDPPAPGRAPAVLRRLSSSELVLLSLRSAGSNPSSRPGLGRRRSGSGSGRSRSGSGTRTRAGSGSTTSAHPANNPRVRRQESGRFDATAGFADPDEKKDESS